MTAAVTIDCFFFVTLFYNKKNKKHSEKATSFIENTELSTLFVNFEKIISSIGHVCVTLKRINPSATQQLLTIIVSVANSLWTMPNRFECMAEQFTWNHSVVHFVLCCFFYCLPKNTTVQGQYFTLWLYSKVENWPQARKCNKENITKWLTPHWKMHWYIISIEWSSQKRFNSHFQIQNCRNHFKIEQIEINKTQKSDCDFVLLVSHSRAQQMCEFCGHKSCVLRIINQTSHSLSAMVRVVHGMFAIDWLYAYGCRNRNMLLTVGNKATGQY